MVSIAGADDANMLRKPEIMADAAYAMLSQDSLAYTYDSGRKGRCFMSNSGHFAIDEDVLNSQGIRDLDCYAVKPGTKEFVPDFFVPDNYHSAPLPRKVLLGPTSKL